MFLTPEQLVELTHYKQPFRQRHALTQMRVPFLVRPDGTLAVAASLFDGLGQSRATMAAPKLRLESRHGSST